VLNFSYKVSKNLHVFLRIAKSIHLPL